MKFNLIFLFFLVSCSPSSTKVDNRKSYNSTGFALIYDQSDYEVKAIKKKFNNELLQISQKDLRIGTLIKPTNPKTQESIVLKNIKKTNYPDFYKILITKPVAEKLNIDNKISNEYTVLEVKCKNVPAVLYRITKMISSLGFQINTANVSTYGDRVVDIFYIKNAFGSKVDDFSTMEKIKSSILKILEETDPANQMMKS